MTSRSTAIVWFRRDLRLADNPALFAAAERAERIVALFIHAPEEEGAWCPGAASNWWLHHSLAQLDLALRERGIELTIRRGPTLFALRNVIEATGATQVYWNRLYEPAIAARDRQLEIALQAQGLECETFNAALLFEPWQVSNAEGGPYRVFTPFWRACEARLDTLRVPHAAPIALSAPARPVNGLAPAELELLPRIRWDEGFHARWQPGEAGALTQLETFCDDGLARYGEDRNRPARPGSSRLSPHLHFGEVSPVQCLTAARNALRDHGHRDARAQSSAAAFVRELGWREFAHHLLHHFPHTTDRPLDERFERYPWTLDSRLLDAWQHGRTGYPIVDAGMRELWSTGWMHNRVRMLVASLLTKNLGQSWLEGASWFWHTLVDADLANNTLGWQWTAGCGADAAPFFRIFNPVLQAERFDPDRAYLRQWLPELARLPDAWIHRPWLAPASVLVEAAVELDVTYPRPVVDFAASRASALAAYARLREPVAAQVRRAQRL